MDASTAERSTVTSIIASSISDGSVTSVLREQPHRGEEKEDIVVGEDCDLDASLAADSTTPIQHTATMLQGSLLESLHQSKLSDLGERVRRATRRLECTIQLQTTTRSTSDGMEEVLEDWDESYTSSRLDASLATDTLLGDTLEEKLEQHLAAMERVTQATVSHRRELELALHTARAQLKEVTEEKQLIQTNLKELVKKIKLNEVSSEQKVLEREQQLLQLKQEQLEDQKRLEECRNKLDTTTAEYKQLLSECENNKKIIEDFSKDKIDYELQLSNCEKYIEEIKVRELSVTEKNSQNEANNNELEKVTAEFYIFKQTMNEHILELGERLLQCGNKLTHREQEMQQREDVLGKMQQRETQYRQELLELQSRLQQRKEESDLQKSEVNKFSEHMQKTVEQDKGTNQELRRLQLQLEELEGVKQRAQEVQEELQDANIKLKDLEACKQQLQETKRQLQELEICKQKFKQTRHQLQDLESCKQQLNGVKHQLQDLESRKQQWQETEQKIQETTHKLKETRELYERSQQQVDETRQTLQESTNQLQKSEQSLLSTEQQLRETKFQLDQRESDQQQLRAEREFLQSELNEQLRRVASLQARLDAHKRADGRQEAVELQARLLTVTAELEKARNASTKLKGQVSELQYRVSVLQKQVMERDTEIERLTRSTSHAQSGAGDNSTDARDNTANSRRAQEPMSTQQQQESDRQRQMHLLRVEGNTASLQLESLGNVSSASVEVMRRVSVAHQPLSIPTITPLKETDAALGASLSPSSVDEKSVSKVPTDVPRIQLEPLQTANRGQDISDTSVGGTHSAEASLHQSTEHLLTSDTFSNCRSTDISTQDDVASLDASRMTESEVGRTVDMLITKVDRDGVQVLKLTEFLFLKRQQQGEADDVSDSAIANSLTDQVTALQCQLTRQQRTYEIKLRALKDCVKEHQELLQYLREEAATAPVILPAPAAAASPVAGDTRQRLADTHAIENLARQLAESENDVRRLRNELTEERNSFVQVSNSLTRATHQLVTQRTRHTSAIQELQRNLDDQRRMRELANSDLRKSQNNLDDLRRVQRTPPVSSDSLVSIDETSRSHSLSSSRGCGASVPLQQSESGPSADRLLGGLDEYRQQLQRAQHAADLQSLQHEVAEAQQLSHGWAEQLRQLEDANGRLMEEKELLMLQMESASARNRELEQRLLSDSASYQQLQASHHRLQQRCETLQQEASSSNNSEEMQQRLLLVFSRYLRLQSQKKSLVWQKKYLLSVLRKFQRTEAITATRLLCIVHRTMLGGDDSQLPASAPAHPMTRFRSAVWAVISVGRMRWLVRSMREKRDPSHPSYPYMRDRKDSSIPPYACAARGDVRASSDEGALPSAQFQLQNHYQQFKSLQHDNSCLQSPVLPDSNTGQFGPPDYYALRMQPTVGSHSLLPAPASLPQHASTDSTHASASSGAVSHQPQEVKLPSRLAKNLARGPYNKSRTGASGSLDNNGAMGGDSSSHNYRTRGRREANGSVVAASSAAAVFSPPTRERPYTVPAQPPPKDGRRSGQQAWLTGREDYVKRAQRIHEQLGLMPGPATIARDRDK